MLSKRHGIHTRLQGNCSVSGTCFYRRGDAAGHNGPLKTAEDAAFRLGISCMIKQS